MMASDDLVVFSPNGEYLVHSAADGVLKIWETSTGSLKQEYAPSSHLSATCSCVSWGPGRRSSESPRKKRKRKKSAETVQEPTEDLDLIALGTTAGNLFLYSVAKGELHSRLENKHSGVVNDICWHTETNTLYTCSSDRHIAEWDLLQGRMRHKWKTVKGEIYSVCMCSYNRLLSAGRLIKLWNTCTREVIKTFTGHFGEIFQLLPILHTADSGGGYSMECSYFISAARNDRLVSVWTVDESNIKDNLAIVSFSLPNEACQLSLSKPLSKEQSLLLSVVTKNGELCIFEHTLNGKLKRPLWPKLTVHITSSGKKEAVPKQIPILAAFVCKDGNILIAHGSFLKPTFEKVSSQFSQRHLYLIREELSKSVKESKNVSKIKTPEVSKDLTVLAPGNMASCGPSQPKCKKQKRSSLVTEMTMEQRLKAISLDSSGQMPPRLPPTADSLSILLTQGLQSEDKRILNNVFQMDDKTSMQKTVKQLPVHVIVPLTKELARRMLDRHGPLRYKLVKWLKMLLSVHTSYLMAFPEIIDTFSSFYQLIDARVAMFGKLSRLQGKLEMLLSQVTSQNKEDEKLYQQQPLLTYQDESSEEEFDMTMEDIMPSHSESEYNWNDDDDDDDDDDTNDSDNWNGDPNMAVKDRDERD